ncbi:ABC-F family ATP-binding cassette domain-containing protein [Sporolactobacillus sp. THM19-2]|jgi:ATPase subunit of ABC transporter with duplicated ATPase domains|uniref:ABC-F family ATP-binding cassette domain-containing protein n=1 Tax=Sporolactobacillus sp. THM19-2 TaxID=2511171 RepID=UPI00101FD905|nr:ABC-F family ATP-binding cassette domain-containing protein [Sporolactobacillus sp. THM19-2]RYL92188.1 ABC-F family ATP-binding cassette domain-containing protein [Sporolactobacillus sp. THM19-2]
MLLVEAKNVSFSYGDKLIYRKMNFRLLEGEHIALVGRNGAGKSTFLKLLTGQLLADGGSIEKRRNLHIGLIEQHLHFRKHHTIYTFMKSAFQDLLNAESRMNELTMKMQQPDVDPAWIDEYGRLQDKLLAHDFYTIDARISEMAEGLGLSALGMDTPVNRMSGGQLTKLCLARLLLEAPEMLLLDEPTNYLDVAHINWLTDYLRDYPHAFIVVSHDTAFLNRIANVVYHLENHELIRYVGNYNSFMKQHELRQEQLEIAYRQQQRNIKKLETYIQKNKVRTATARQAKSREKQLDKIERMDPPATVRKPSFHFKVDRQPVRTIFAAKRLTAGYDHPLLPPVDAEIIRGEKIALVGHNGIGKTTFLKTLLGLIPPLSGRVVTGDRVMPGYFAQISAPPDLTPLEWMKEQFPRLEEKVIRQHLAQCGVYAEHMRQPMNTLSGGEETKVRIGQLMLLKSNVLIFDEPTNHLDVDAKEALSEALEKYTGTVLVVSHESSFFKRWVTKVWNIENWSSQSRADHVRG